MRLVRLMIWIGFWLFSASAALADAPIKKTDIHSGTYLRTFERRIDESSINPPNHNAFANPFLRASVDTHHAFQEAIESINEISVSKSGKKLFASSRQVVEHHSYLPRACTLVLDKKSDPDSYQYIPQNQRHILYLNFRI